MTSKSRAWREWPLAQLEREYSPSSCVPSMLPFLEAYAKQSKGALELLRCDRNLVWGEGVNETFDFFPAASRSAPLLVFFHGGYWQELSKDDSLFIAPGCVANGVAFAAIEYTLAPRATVSAIVDQCRRAIRSLVLQASALGFDPRRIVVSGSSAGAHLAAMLLAGTWPNNEKPSDAIAGAVLLSGIYDLEPLVPTYINRALHLSETGAATVSPVGLQLGPPAPVIVAWGENETSEFKRQSQLFASKLKDAGFPVKSLQVDGANHFDLVFGISDRNSKLGKTVLKLINNGTFSG
jgi:arylformamidase